MRCVQLLSSELCSFRLICNTCRLARDSTRDRKDCSSEKIETKLSRPFFFDLHAVILKIFLKIWCKIWAVCTFETSVIGSATGSLEFRINLKTEVCYTTAYQAPSVFTDWFYVVRFAAPRGKCVSEFLNQVDYDTQVNICVVAKLDHAGKILASR